MNPQMRGSKGTAICLPLTEYDKLIAQPWLRDTVLKIRGGNDKAKGELPFRAAHYGRFLKNHRSQKDADPTSFLFQTTIDIDDKELVGIAIEMARQLNCSDSIWKGMLLHLEYSARKKFHIDIRMPIGMTIEETQRGLSQKGAHDRWQIVAGRAGNKPALPAFPTSPYLYMVLVLIVPL